MKTKKKTELGALQKLEKHKNREQAKVDKLRRTNASKEKERNVLEELKEQDTELIRQNEKDIAVINDENATPSEREAAEARVAEREEELARLRTQVQEREEARLLWERVKDTFKKYGWTLQAVVLAASLVIGAVVLKIMTALKSGIKAVGNCPKEIGKKKKNASFLPGLIGSIASFIFKAAGQVISFLAEHAWILILAVVAFLIERVIKRNR